MTVEGFKRLVAGESVRAARVGGVEAHTDRRCGWRGGSSVGSPPQTLEVAKCHLGFVQGDPVWAISTWSVL